MQCLCHDYTASMCVSIFMCTKMLLCRLFYIMYGVTDFFYCTFVLFSQQWLNKAAQSINQSNFHHMSLNVMSKNISFLSRYIKINVPQSTPNTHPHCLPIWRRLWVQTWENFLFPPRIKNCIHHKVLDRITCPFPNFNGCTVEVWE